MEIQQSIMEIVRVVDMQAASHKTEIIVKVPKWHIIGDKQRIQQVCMNLLSNAVKFTMDGKITITAWIKEPRVKHVSATSSANA
jgi:signal transduction histidine kinase